MTALSFLPANALAAAFAAPRRRQISIRAQEVKERANARRAAEEAKLKAHSIPSEGVAKITIPSTAQLAMWDGAEGRYAFHVVTGADREKLNASPVILLAMRRSTGLIAGVRAFEVEDRALLNAWINRAEVTTDIELHARFKNTSRADRAAVVADLALKPARPTFVAAGKFDLRAIMLAAHAAAQADRNATGRVWGVCFSAALADVWQAAKAARAVAA